MLNQVSNYYMKRSTPSLLGRPNYPARATGELPKLHALWRGRLTVRRARLTALWDPNLAFANAVVDNIVFSPQSIPEPATAALLALAALPFCKYLSQAWRGKRS